MSIAAASRQSFGVASEAKSPEFREASSQPDVDSALETVTQWIPTEVVAVYVAILGIFMPEQDDGKWVAFAVGGLLVPGFVWLNTALVNKRGAEKWKEEGHQGDPPMIGGRRAWLLVLMAGVAFVVWAAALPASPFLDISDQAGRVAGVLVILVSLAMPKIAELLDLKVPQA